MGDNTRHRQALPNISSAASQWAPLAKLIGREHKAGLWAGRQGNLIRFGYEFLRFGIKQGWACLFGGMMLALLVATHFWYPEHAILSRYDFLVAGAVAIQAGMLIFRLETLEEAKVILAFHAIGTAMEIFKTAHGSWAYPETGFIRIAGVPLFSGFMYAAVGSYIARVWRLFDFEFTHHPPLWAVSALALAIYVNFFAHHYLPDLRPVLFLAAAVLFGRTSIYYRVWKCHRRMPLLLGLGLVALFIWFAENIATFSRAWSYPHQAKVWTLVPLTKLGAWFLLMLISYVLVALVQGIRMQHPRAKPETAPEAAAMTPASTGTNARVPTRTF
jgi:uncharacterized membrane protein YoaT (DUF817 family)